MTSPRVALALALALACSASCGARTGLSDAPFALDTLTCQDIPYLARPSRPKSLYVTLPHAAVGQAQWSVTRQPVGAHPTVTHDGGTTATFQADVEGEYEVRVTAPNGDSGAPISCAMRVIVRAMGPIAACPAELVTTPLHTVAIAARAEGDRPITRVTWAVERVPSTSAHPQPRPADRAATSYTPDVAGEYALRLRVTDDAGLSDECVTVVRAVPREGLRVELVWDPPGRTCPRESGAACDRSDVDLHLLRDPGTGTRWRSNDECYYFNCNAAAGRSLAWGMSGSADDPRLDIDDVDGHGPENINLDRPTARAYRIGVHYFDAHGAGAQAATVLVYCGAASPVARLGPVTLAYRGSAEASDVWLAADVVPSSPGGCEVRPLTHDGAMPWVLSYNDVARGAGPSGP